MKITKQYLTQIIKEEIEELLREGISFDAEPNYRETLKSYKPFIDKYKNISFEELSEIDLKDLAKLYMFSEESYRKLAKIYSKNQGNMNSRYKNEEGQGEAAAMELILKKVKHAWDEKTKFMKPGTIPKLATYAGSQVGEFV